MNANFANNNFDKLFDYVETNNPSAKSEVIDSKARPSAKTALQKKVHEVLLQGDKLNEKHEQYVAEFIVRGNKALYALLAEIYQYALLVDASPYKENIVFTMRKELKEKYGIRTGENTSLMMLVVKYVVRDIDRQTAYNYATALGFAYTKDVAVEDIASYITESGGIAKLAKGTTTEEQKSKSLALKNKTDALMKAIYARALYFNNKIELDESEVVKTWQFNTANKKESNIKPGYFEFAIVHKEIGTGENRIAAVFGFDEQFEHKIFEYIASQFGGDAEQYQKTYENLMQKLSEKQKAEKVVPALPAP